MSHPLRRSRRASLAGGLVLALSLASAPAALAQDGPEETLSGLMSALEAKDFSNLAAYFCPEHAGQAAAFDISGLAAGVPGVDPSAILDAIILDTEITTLEVVEQSDTEATVRIEGSIATGMDPEKLGPFVEAVLTATGEEVTPEAVEVMTATLTAQAEPTTITIAEEVTLTPGQSGGWVICDELGEGEAPSASPVTAAASPASAAASLPAVPAGSEPAASLEPAG